MRRLVIVTLFGMNSTLHTRQSSIQSDKHQVSYRYISPDDGHIVARNMYRKEINILRKKCAPNWFYLQDCTAMHGQQNIKYTLRH